MKPRRNKTRLLWLQISVAFSVVLSPSVIRAAQSDNWPRWRGPNDDGVAARENLPTTFDAEHVLWKAALPGKGCSTPIVWNQRVYLTAPVEGKDAVLAFDASGKLLWQTTLGPERPGKHRNGSGSNASPATDGEIVAVYFKSGNFAALGLDGKLRWQTNLVEAFGRDTLFWDHGTSPVLTEKYIVMARMHHGESWLAAFDKATGALKWKSARNYETPMENDHGYSTPLLIRHENKEALLTWGGEHLTIHDVADGKLLWTCGGFNPSGGKNWPAVASPVLLGDTAVVAFGRSDRGSPLLYGVKLGTESVSTNHLWRRSDTGTFVPTPAVWKNRIYLLRDRGELECLDPLTGKTIWTDAFPKSSANYYGSPLIAGGKLYAAREDGVVFVARVGDKFELVSENAMNERIIASPVPAANHLLIRGEQHLFCVGAE